MPFTNKHKQRHPTKGGETKKVDLDVMWVQHDVCLKGVRLMQGILCILPLPENLENVPQCGKDKRSVPTLNPFHHRTP